MPEKSKSYDKIKIPFDVISKAHDIFINYLPEDERKEYFVIFNIGYPEEDWKLDNIDQFISEYRRENIKSASMVLAYNWQSCRFRFGYMSGSSTVEILLPTIEAITKVFSIFDDYYKDSIKAENNKSFEVKQEVKQEAKYSYERKLPSLNVNRSLLKELEEYIRKRASQLTQISYEKTRSNLGLSIQDSLGTESLNSIDDFNHQYFPDNTKDIRIGYYGSDNNQKIKVTIRFSKDRLFSDLDIDNTGESSKEITEGISNGIFEILNEYKNHAFILHPPFAIQGLSIGVSFTILVFVLVNLFAKYDIKLAIAAISLLCFLILFWFLGTIDTYCVFETKRNENQKGIRRFLIEGILGGLIVTFIVSILSKIFGF